MKKIVVVPGTFDPITTGHYDIIKRAAVLFDEVVVLVSDNTAKSNMFSLEERMEIAAAACGGLSNVKVTSQKGIVSEYAKNIGAVAIVKGVRGVSDFDYEMQISKINHELADCETIFIPSKSDVDFVSSSFVRELIIYKRDFNRYLPKNAQKNVENILKIL